MSVGDTSRIKYGYLEVTIVDYKDTNCYMDIYDAEVDIVEAGSSFELTGKAYASYTTGNTSNYLDDMRLGVLLPTGITLSEENIYLYDKNDNKVNMEKLSVVNYSQGKDMWIIDVDPTFYAGYYSEDINDINKTGSSISTGNGIYFKLRFDTDSNMVNTNLDTEEMFYFTTKNLKACEWVNNYHKEDPLDLNENGDVTDYIIKADDAILISIVADAEAVNIEESISNTGNGGVEGKTAVIETKDDIVTYSIKAYNVKSGTLKLFNHYIAIPKRDSVKDTYLVKENENGLENFDFELKDEVRFEGTAVFEALYTVEKNLDFQGMYNLEKEKWLTKSNLLSNYTWADVTGIKIRTKSDWSISGDFNSTMHIDMKINSDYVNVEKNNWNNWASRTRYQFSYSSGIVGGYSNVEGCAARISDKIEEDIKDGAKRYKDEIEALDETPRTDDEMSDKLKKYQLLIIISLVGMVCIKNTIMCAIKNND